MNYTQLMDEHEAIEHASAVLLVLARPDAANPREASVALEMLATLLRDHLAKEDPVIYATVLAAKGSRHGTTAAAFAAQLEALKSDWTDYLYRWDAARVCADWSRFVDETREMLPRIRARVSVETTVLYSLALHHEVIAP